MKVLGLDLGPTSIGWALIEIDSKNTPTALLGLGSRVIPKPSTRSVFSVFAQIFGEESVPSAGDIET